MFCMLILAGFSLKRIVQTGVVSKTEKGIFLIFGLSLIILTFFAFSKTTVVQLQETFNEILSLKEFSNNSFYSHFIINSIVLVVIIWCMCF